MFNQKMICDISEMTFLILIIDFMYCDKKTARTTSINSKSFLLKIKLDTYLHFILYYLELE